MARRLGGIAAARCRSRTSELIASSLHAPFAIVAVGDLVIDRVPPPSRKAFASSGPMTKSRYGRICW